MTCKDLTKHYKWVMVKTAMECLENNSPDIKDFSGSGEYEVNVSDGYGLDVDFLLALTYSGGVYDIDPTMCEDAELHIDLIAIEVYVDYMEDEVILKLDDFKKHRDRINSIINEWCN